LKGSDHENEACDCSLHVSRCDRHGGDLHRSRQGQPIIRRVLLRQVVILDYVNPF